MNEPQQPAPSPDDPDADLVPSTAPGASSQADAEATGGADAVPMSPADDGLAGRSTQAEPVEPPADQAPDAERSRTS